MTVRTKRWVWSLITISIMCLIFLFSNQNGDESTSTSGFFVALFPFIENKELLKFCIRKLAHFSIFASLGFCFFQSIDTYEISLRKKLFYSVLFCFGYACFDELHQAFIPERSPQILDIGIDTFGATIAIALSSYLNKKRQ